MEEFSFGAFEAACRAGLIEDAGRVVERWGSSLGLVSRGLFLRHLLACYLRLEADEAGQLLAYLRGERLAFAQCVAMGPVLSDVLAPSSSERLTAVVECLPELFVEEEAVHYRLCRHLFEQTEDGAVAGCLALARVSPAFLATLLAVLPDLNLPAASPLLSLADVTMHK